MPWSRLLSGKMDEYQEHDLDDATEGLKADLIKLTQLLESELDEIEQFEAAEDSLNEGEEDRHQLNAVVGSDESPDVGLYKRRSRELPAGTQRPNRACITIHNIFRV